MTHPSRIVSQVRTSGRYSANSARLLKNRKPAAAIVKSEHQKNRADQKNVIFGSSQLKRRSGSKMLLRQNRTFRASLLGERVLLGADGTVCVGAADGAV